jgi:hypothetical protein
MKQAKDTLPGVMRLMIVILYIVTIVPIHEHEHHNHVIEHSDEIHQTDQCHNFIHHGERSSGCANHDHASEDKIECLICHHFASTQKLNLAHSIHVTIHFDEGTTPFSYIQPNRIYWGYVNPLRGPPALA